VSQIAAKNSARSEFRLDILSWLFILIMQVVFRHSLPTVPGQESDL